MSRELTDEECERLGISRDVPEFTERGWTVDQIKEAIAAKGFKVPSLERALRLPVGSIYQSLNKRSPKTDKMIAKFLEVHESMIWPNRYFTNGVSIHASYNIEQRSDDELQKLNAEFSKPRVIKTIHSWVGGPGGGPVVSQFEPVEKDVSDLSSLKERFAVGADGRFIVPIGDGTVAPDEPALVNERQKVSLPVGVIIDETS